MLDQDPHGEGNPKHLSLTIYIFGDFRFIGDIKVMMNKKDVQLNSWIIWDKGTKAQNSTRSYVNVTEHCLFYVKGIRKDLDIPTEINSVRDYLRDEKSKSQFGGTGEIGRD